MKRLEPRVGVLTSRVSGLPDDAGRNRLDRSPWRAWYATGRWRALRWSVLTDAAFTCAMCGRIEGNTSRLVCDHIEAHRGDEMLFWLRSNLQCLCKACHDGDKQRLEARGRG